MKRLVASAGMALGAGCLMACLTACPILSPLARRPKTAEDIEIKLPSLDNTKLDNGMPVWLAPGSNVHDTAGVGLFLRAGPRYDPPGMEGLAELTANVLRNVNERGDASPFAALGAPLTVSTSGESILLSIEVLSQDAPQALRALASLVHDAEVSAEQLAQARRDREEELEHRAEDPEALVLLAMSERIVGRDFAVTNLGVGRSETVGAITEADVASLLKASASPARAAVVFAGDIDPSQAVGWAAETFADWQGTDEAASVATQGRPEPGLARSAIVFVPMEGLEHVLIAMGGPDLPADNANAPALDLAKGLGAGEVHYLLREVRQTSYGASEDGTELLDGSLFAIRARVDRPDVEAAIEGVFARYYQIARNGISESWVESAKVRRLVALMNRAQRSDARIDAVREIFDHDYPATVYEERFGRLRALQASDVSAAFAAWLRPDRLQVVVVGDPQIRGQLESIDAVVTRTPEDLLARG